jgi:tetratricopeptide (TPR) repeat protein
MNSNVDDQKSSENISTLYNSTVTTTATRSNSTHSGPFNPLNFLLIWVAADIDLSKEDYQDTLTQLRSVMDDVNVFLRPDQCIQFLNTMDDKKAFVIISGPLARQLVPNIHSMPQLDAIYIFCENKFQLEQWAKEWTKVKGVHTDLMLICQSLQHAVRQANQDSIVVRFGTVNENASRQNLDQLEPSFMCTQLFKEILLEMNYDRQSFKDFITYCRNSDYGPPHDINRFEKEYRPELAIWWYTYDSFIYPLLNNSLRMMEVGTIIKMGFFVHDLHHQIEQLHRKQIGDYHGKSFIVYRGQGLCATDFEKLCKTRDGLMSFNSFLSTSRVREVAHVFAVSSLEQTDMVGIHFEMTIDPSISSIPFAAIDELSYYTEEQEILFSMHTVFRIGEIKQIDKNRPLYQVYLKLTADGDQDLRTLAKRIRVAAGHGIGWQRLGQLLLQMSRFDMAEKLYIALLEQTSDQHEKALYYNQLGCVKNNQGDYEKAVCFYEKAIEIYQKSLPPNHPYLATSYSSIGVVYHIMREYSKALSFHERALEIGQKTLPPNHPDLATSCSSIGVVYHTVGEYSKALSFHERALEIRENALPANRSDCSQSCNNIGVEYDSLGKYTKTLSFHEKALEIRRSNRPVDQHDLTETYHNIGSVYHNMKEYSKALSFYEQALKIRQNILPRNHLLLATSYNNIGAVHVCTGEYSKAVLCHDKALQIRQSILPPNNPYIAQTYNNIGEMYRSIGQYSKGLSFYEKACEIFEKTLPANHSALATSYNNIAFMYRNTGEYSKAFSLYQRALDILQSSLPSNHPHLQSVQQSIEIVKKKMCNNA